jgi:protein subunit release factor B
MAQRFKMLVPSLERIVCPSVNRYKHTYDHSKVPILHPEDLEEEFTRGSGPGGQAVNKTSNAVILRHKPSGLIVKCHQTRSLAKNRELAREILTQKLDQLINGEESIEAQKKRILEKKSKENTRRSEKLTELKEKWKKREGIE